MIYVSLTLPKHLTKAITQKLNQINYKLLIFISVLENRVEYCCYWLGLSMLGVVPALINSNLKLVIFFN